MHRCSRHCPMLQEPAAGAQLSCSCVRPATSILAAWSLAARSAASWVGQDDASDWVDAGISEYRALQTADRLIARGVGVGLRCKHAAEQRDRSREGLVGGFGVETRALVASEGVCGGYQAHLVVGPRGFHAAIHDGTRFFRYVWILRT